ncbi:hypothetical protein [Devosia sp.]|uniref:hypothetical protein n=1 Tax=Devosia sp. TaxID=1871048 RepID=UPI001AC2D990|nr:hypothetical protein [Devosia sp.]MBN9308915.1 hypothetical protein [Devosia sp.]
MRISSMKRRTSSTRMAVDEEVRIGAGGDLGSNVSGRLITGALEDAAGEVEGERGLADAERAVDQDAARQAAGVEALEELGLCGGVAEDRRLVLGRGDAFELVGLSFGIVQLSRPSLPRSRGSGG